MLDPITGRDISSQCWNSHHEEAVYYPGHGTEHIGCEQRDCGCLCHPRNQVEPVPVVPGFEDPCIYCLGLKEVPVHRFRPMSFTYVPCPKCCSTRSSEKETV